MKIYKVTLNWYGENQVFYTSAKSKPPALQNAIGQLSKKLGVFRSIVALNIMTKDRYKIEEDLK